MLYSSLQHLTIRFAAVFLCVLWLSPIANSAIFNVDINADIRDDAPGDGICDGFEVAFSGCSIRAAVMEANALPGIDIIVLPANMTLFIDREGIDNNAFSGDLDILESVIIGTFTLSDDELPTVRGRLADNRIFDIHPDANVTLQNFRITGGDATNLGALGRGGAIFVRPSEDTSVTIDHVELMGNIALRGGAIYSQGTMVTIIDSLIHNNAASLLGGAIVTIGEILFIQESSIYNNFNFGPNTEAVLIASSAEFGNAAARISNTTIVENNNTGILASGQFILNLENVTITDNQTRGLIAISGDLDQPSTLLMSHSIIADNGGNNCLFSTLNFIVNDFNISDDASCQLSMGVTSMENIDPLLSSPRQDTQTWHRISAPMFTSPVLDSGDPTGGCTAIDQRGNNRPQDGNNDTVQRCDIGAIEVLPLGEEFLIDGFES